MAGDSRRTSERTVGNDQSRSHRSEEPRTWQDVDSGLVIGDRTSCQNCGGEVFKSMIAFSTCAKLSEIC